MNDRNIKEAVREHYGQIALQAVRGKSSCCAAISSSASNFCCGAEPRSRNDDAITSNLYTDEEASALPAAAVTASLGCGNPTALVPLHPGETVLDLGSGGGIDVLLSAQRVGATGKFYGLDMTDEMVALARHNQQHAGARNVEFLKGEIECIPLPDNSVDVIISNCVINLSADKDRVFAEAFRVLKPGGRFAVFDIVVRGAIPGEIRQNMESWTGCVAGALEEEEYRTKLAGAGFAAIEVVPTRIYSLEDIGEVPVAMTMGTEAVVTKTDSQFMSAFVRARKTLAK
jgi:arsenite methyltransferase